MIHVTSKTVPGEHSKKLSAWEYVLWALDKDVWTMALAHLPDSTQEAIDLLTILLAQYENIETMV